MKKIIPAFILSAALIGTVSYTAYSNHESENASDQMVVKPIKASFMVDVNNPAALVGNVDNTFVGYVEKKVDTVYKDVETVDTDNGTKQTGSPYTNYQIKVVDNLKGNLKKNTPIPVQKEGGLSLDGETYFLYEDDILPEEGKYYIFNTFTQPNGDILISGPNSSIELASNSKSAIVSSDEYKEYKKAVKNQIKHDRQHFTSQYDEQ